MNLNFRQKSTVPTRRESNVFTFVSASIFFIVEVFSGFEFLPFLSNINQRYLILSQKSSYFSVLTWNPYCWIQLKTEKHSKNSTWDAAAMMMSSIYIATPVNQVSMASIVCWNMTGAGLILNLRWLNLSLSFV